MYMDVPAGKDHELVIDGMVSRGEENTYCLIYISCLSSALRPFKFNVSVTTFQLE